jgi:hypothetical protein
MAPPAQFACRLLALQLAFFPPLPPRPPSADELDSARFAKLCRDCGLLDRRFTAGYADVAFAMARRGKEQRR